MALSSTIYTFDIELAHVDRHVYESINLRMPMHPSESEEYFVTRLLAYCLEYSEGIGFSKGVSDPDDPTMSVRDLTGALQLWVEIGAPDAARLHKASKASPRVAVYTHKDPAVLQRQLAGAKIHRADEVALYAVDREFIAELVGRLDRRMKLSVSISDGTVYIVIGAHTVSGTITRLPLQPG